MNPYLALVYRVCLSLAAIGFVAGFLLLLVSFVLTPNVAISYRSLVLTWFGGYLVAVGGAYVLLSNQAVKDAPHGAPQTDIFSGCPQRLRRAGHIVVVAAFTTFFVAIALVESAVVNRSVGEAAILGAFSVGAFAAMFGGLWSALSRGHQNAA
jgi:hypothetical protein